ncbi:extracellular solute-binding protein [Leisingera methylohalidivorans]|uniref:ABC transporter substrate-binding protein n=1 Tax=Leisingera methylohalidivorans DSM 14336 TaxID=999552 RepID=V9VXT4_9RHOB|nr:extracellular solute-binding protein [Leisingera methylohalidivorans]AHD02185.1 ABC transporter substrate-binding protein [Leisingera methylohalidivorans DSM 14336]
MKFNSLIPGALALGLTVTPVLASEPVLYTSNPVPAVEAVQAAVHESAGTDLGVITGGSGVLLRRIEAEADAPQGDVFWSTSINTVGAFKSNFEAYSSPELAAVKESLRYPDDLFQPANIHVVTMLVNSYLLDGAEMPGSWADLADPAWKGRVMIPDPANSSTGYTIAWGLSKLLDQETFEAVVSNLVISGSSSAVPRGVAMGEYAVGLTFETNGYAYVDGGQEELQLVYPAEGTFITADYSGLVQNAPAGENAKKVIDTLMSKETQTELLMVAFRRPSRTDIKVSDYVGLPELGDIKIFDVDEGEAATSREDFLAKWATLPKAGS